MAVKEFIIIFLVSVGQIESSPLDSLFGALAKGFESLVEDVQQALLNIAVDYILARAREDLQDVVGLPDAHKDYELLDTSIVLQQGVLHGLTSVERAGDVAHEEAKDPGYKILGIIPLQFTNIEVVYEKYIIELDWVKDKRKVNSTGRAVTTKQNVTATVDILLGSTHCDMAVKKVEFNKFDDFEVNLTPDKIGKPGDINVVNEVFNNLLNVFNTLIKDAVKQSLTRQVNLAVINLQKECKN